MSKAIYALSSGVRFLVEIFSSGAIIYAGLQFSQPFVIVSTLLVLVYAGLWSIYVAPKSRNKSLIKKISVEILVFGTVFVGFIYINLFLLASIYLFIAFLTAIICETGDKIQ